MPTDRRPAPRHIRSTYSAGVMKSPALYVVIVTVASLLVVALAFATTDIVRGAFRFATWIGILVVVCNVFIAYFWLNGTKDIVYTLWFHLRMKGATETAPKRWPRPYLPKVVMLYCTCNDFEPTPLQRSMVQDYPNYEVVILDDSSKPEYLNAVSAFAADNGIQVIRRADRKGFKAGNLNNGLTQLDYEYFVILDSDEVVPPDFIKRSLDYFDATPTAGIVQANHRASRNRNAFMKRFSIGVDSHWITYQTVKDRYGFMSLLGHGAMVSRECYEAVGGFPALVSEDLCLSIEARRRGYLTVFAPDVMCEEEYPVDFLAFKKRHNKWTQGNMEFIKTYTGRIMFSPLTWFEKLDIVLFTYSLPLTALFSVYVIINVIVFPAVGFTLHYPLWMLGPTVLFLVAPMLNDVVFYWGKMKKRTLAMYLLQSTLLYGSMFFVSLRASVKALFGGSVFLVTPKEDQDVSFLQSLRANWVEFVLCIGLAVAAVLLTGNFFSVALIVVPALFMAYLSRSHHARPSVPVIPPQLVKDDRVSEDTAV